MATISQGGVTLPTWFLACVVAAFLTGTGTVISVAWNTSDTVRQDHDTLAQHEQRLQSLEGLKTDVASLKTDVGNMKDTTSRIESKIDRLVERELGRRGHE